MPMLEGPEPAERRALEGPLVRELEEPLEMRGDEARSDGAVVTGSLAGRGKRMRGEIVGRDASALGRV